MSKKKVIYRNVAGECMLIPVGETVNEYNGVFILSPSAAFIFSAYREGKSAEEITEALLNEFDVDRATAEKDVTNLLAELDDMEIIG